MYVLSNDFDECKSECSIRVQQLMYTVFTALRRYCSEACDISLLEVLHCFMHLCSTTIYLFICNAQNSKLSMCVLFLDSFKMEESTTLFGK